jgi:hypothetical protein
VVARTMTLSTMFMMLGQLACASLPAEPAIDAQLWKQQGCFAHILPDWRHLQTSRLAGSVFTQGQTRAEGPIPSAVVFAREWPNGTLRRAQVDTNGDFAFPDVATGIYEVAICAMGWNPWRGTVRVAGGVRATRLDFPLTLGI